MSINLFQFKNFIVKPVCQALKADDPAAINLLLGTAAQETHMGRWLVQQGIGMDGGLGIYQMEAPTYHWIYSKKISQNKIYKEYFRLLSHYHEKPLAQRLISDHMLATFMARLYYMTFPEPLPNKDDIKGLAAYWKKYWNTEKGKGTEDEFIENYKRFVDRKR